jgi:hypothetical protein
MIYYIGWPDEKTMVIFSDFICINLNLYNITVPWSHDWYFLYQFTDSDMTTNCTLTCHSNYWHLDIGTTSILRNPQNKMETNLMFMNQVGQALLIHKHEVGFQHLSTELLLQSLLNNNLCKVNICPHKTHIQQVELIQIMH